MVIHTKASPENKKLNAPLVAVDTVVFGVVKGRLSALLIQIDKGPYKDKWAIPGGLVRMEESLDTAAVRVLGEKTNVRDVYLEQLYTFGEPKRDVRGRSVSVAYFALVGNSEKFNLQKHVYYRDIQWFPIGELPELAFDHKEIIKVAYERLKGKLEYTTIAYSLLPKEFTLTKLQRTYELILNKKLDKRNFRKKIMALDIVENLGKSETAVAHRPAELYRFKKRGLEFF